MISKKQIVKVWLPLVTILFLSSCLEKTQSETFDVVVDAYTVKRVIDTEPEYAITFMAYGNQPILNATVSNSDNSGQIIQLTQNPSSPFIFWKDPNANDFHPEIPGDTEYKFSVTSESGTAVEKYDNIKPIDLAIPQIDSLIISTNQQILTLNWKKVNGADGYIINIKKINGQTIYTSKGLFASDTEYEMSPLLGNWIENVNIGDDYILELHAFAYEDSAVESNTVYNVEEISIAQQYFIWE